ncbi:MAG: HlyD family efflux transporter periplasmic adaptor subunit, partial [Planctomycetota bacterium]
EKPVIKPPRPVSVMKLSRVKELQRQLITGTIAAWKTEKLGFEVSGRISFVIEKNDEVQPTLPSKLALPPTPLARIEPERFEIAVKSAEADKQVAEKRLSTNRVSIDLRIPAVIESAASELEFAKAEFRRVERLQNSISQSESDSVRNRLSLAKSALASARAELAQAHAEKSALESQLLRAELSLDEAQRNLRNATLYSSFRGIISEVHAVSGSYVAPGDPVATVQMMDPMLVQFEVSPRESRTYNKGDILDVLITDQDGKRQVSHGMVYNVDAVADQNSRTYTVTLHIRNFRESQSESTSLAASTSDRIARTERIFPLDMASVITGGAQPLIEQSCLHQIGKDTVVWKITNRKLNQASDVDNRVLNVEPVKVQVGRDEITLLGQWKFVPVTFENPAALNLKNDLVTGKLKYAAENCVNSSQSNTDLVNSLSPRKVILEHQRWVLRAGDVVQVVKSGNGFRRGYFVPMKAILSEAGKTFIHIVESNEQQEAIAKRVYVDVQDHNSLSDNTVRVQVEPTVGEELVDGMQVVIGGSHYLDHGDRVKIIQRGSK